MRILFTILCLLITSCSGTTRIASDATQVGKKAQSSRERFVRIQNDVAEGTSTERIIEEAIKGEAEQLEIISVVQDIHKTLPTVKDVTPWWADMISKVMVGLSILCCCFLVWYLGIGSFVKKLLYSLGMFIPEGTKRDATMAVDALDDTKKETLRESIAVRRASDPAFDNAFKKERVKRESK